MHAENIAYCIIFSNNSIIRPLETSIKTINSNIQEIRDTRSNRNLACRNMEYLQKVCRLLIQDIHADTNDKE